MEYTIETLQVKKSILENYIRDKYGPHNKCLDYLFVSLWCVLSYLFEKVPFIHITDLDVRQFAQAVYYNTNCDSVILDITGGYHDRLVSQLVYDNIIEVDCNVISNHESLTEQHLKSFWEIYLPDYSIKLLKIRIDLDSNQVLECEESHIGEGDELEFLYMVLRLYNDSVDGHYVLVSDIDMPILEYKDIPRGEIVNRLNKCSLYI